MREMTTTMLHAKRMLVAIDDGAAQSERSAKLLKTGASAASAASASASASAFGTTATDTTPNADSLVLHGFLQQLDVRDAQLDFPVDSHDDAHDDTDGDVEGSAVCDHACGEKCSDSDQVQSQFEPEPEPEFQLESQPAETASPQARDGHDKNEMEANHPVIPLDVSAATGEPNSVDPELEADVIASADRMPHQSWETTLKTTSSFTALLFDEPATHECGSSSDPCQIGVDGSASMLTYLDALLASDDEDLGVDVDVDVDAIDVNADEIDVNVDAIGHDHDHVSKQQPVPGSGYENSPIFAHSETPRPKAHVSVDTATATTSAAVAGPRDREILTVSTMASIPQEIVLRLEVATHFIFAIVTKLGLDTSTTTTTSTSTRTSTTTALSTRTAEFAVDWFVHILSAGVRFTGRDQEDGLAMAVLLTAIRQADGFKTPLELALASGVAESQILTSLLVLVTVPPMKTENKSVDGYARRMCELLDLPAGTADVVARGRLVRVLLDVAEVRAPLVVAAVAFWVAFGFGTPELERSVEQVRVALSRADGPANYSHLKHVIDKIDCGRASIFLIVMTRP